MSVNFTDASPAAPAGSINVKWQSSGGNASAYLLGFAGIGGVNNQTGVTYAIVEGDKGKLVSLSNAAAIAVTLPNANTLSTNWLAWVENRGAGAATITPTVSTIDGAASIMLAQNQGLLVASDGTNYFTFRGWNLPVRVGKLDLTAQSADVGATTVFAVPAGAGGAYRVGIYTAITQAATTSSTLPQVKATWTDADNSTGQTMIATPSNTGNSLTTVQQAEVRVNAAASTNIQVLTTGFATSGATGMQFALHIRVEEII